MGTGSGESVWGVPGICKHAGTGLARMPALVARAEVTILMGTANAVDRGGAALELDGVVA
ncbi:hypothetical protein GN958_ATG04885 [Phytophthora infestans]|uniref:Uncharacterized protein n=1 Tax=Phytophthora infestans TaxID=4787 RepID=A0A8S9UZ93_PHYIN|nr:hypothetical protein GN958_ATG04885 [Phytophthora infestans]